MGDSNIPQISGVVQVYVQQFNGVNHAQTDFGWLPVYDYPSVPPIAVIQYPTGQWYKIIPLAVPTSPVAAIGMPGTPTVTPTTVQTPVAVEPAKPGLFEADKVAALKKIKTRMYKGKPSKVRGKVAPLSSLSNQDAWIRFESPFLQIFDTESDAHPSFVLNASKFYVTIFKDRKGEELKILEKSTPTYTFVAPSLSPIAACVFELSMKDDFEEEEEPEEPISTPIIVSTNPTQSPSTNTILTTPNISLPNTPTATYYDGNFQAQYKSGAGSLFSGPKWQAVVCKLKNGVLTVFASGTEEMVATHDLSSVRLEPTSGKKSDTPILFVWENTKKWEYSMADGFVKRLIDCSNICRNNSSGAAAGAGTDSQAIIPTLGSSSSSNSKSNISANLGTGDDNVAVLPAVQNWVAVPPLSSSFNYTFSKSAHVHYDLSIFKAAEQGELVTVQHYVAQGAKLGDIDPDQNSALMCAASAGQLPVVAFLHSKGASVKQKGKYERTPLLLAAAHGHIETVQWLLQHGSSITEKENLGETSLIVAAQNGHTRMVSWLLTSGGASITEKTNSGRTCLLSAAETGNLELLQYLVIYHNADLSTTSNSGDGVPHLLASTNCLDGLKWISSRGVNVTAKNTSQESPLMNACYYGKLNNVKWLISKGCSVAEKSSPGNTPLLRAAFGGKVDVMKYLLELGADLFAKDNSGENALHKSAEYGRADMVKFLLSKKFPTHLKINSGRTAAELARKNNHVEVAKIIEQGYA